MREYTRLYWHGFPATFEQFLRWPYSYRWFAELELSDLIHSSNESGSGQPDDYR